MALIEDGVLKTWLLDCATARELGLETTGHAHRGASSTPSPGPTNLHLEPGTRSPAELIKDIDGRLLRHRPDRLGRQHRHRRLQPRRRRLLDRERRAHLSGQRSDHRRSHARHVPDAAAGERSAIPLRHQRADTAGGGTDHCRRLSHRVGPPTASASPRRCGTAGAIALKFFRGTLQELDQGQRAIRRCPRRTSRSTICCASGCRVAGDGWLSEESENDPARLDARRVWVVDPIDGTRAFIAGREDWSISAALVEAGRPVVAAVFAPATRRTVSRRRGRRRDPQRHADPGQRGLGSRRRPHRRAQAPAGLDRRPSSGARCHAARAFAGAAAGARRAGRARWRDRRRQRPRLGPCGCRSFGARSRRPR